VDDEGLHCAHWYQCVMFIYMRDFLFTGMYV